MARLLVAAAFALASGSNLSYEKCTTSGLSEVLLAQRTEVEAFYLDFGREAEAQADAAIRNLWLGTPHASSFPSYADMTDNGNTGCKADESLSRLSDVYWTGWSQTEWFNNSCPVELKKQGYTGADWQSAKQAGCTYSETTVISEYCSREYPECPTQSALDSGVDTDYIQWHFSGPAGTRSWKTHDNYTFCPVFCLQPNRFNNSLNEFAMQLSDGAELRWHELTSNSFKGGLRPTTTSYENAEFFHQGFGWAWFYISFHGGLFRFTPELHSLFGVTWCQFIGPDNVWPYAYEAFPTSNPDKITWWTTPYKDLAWNKYQVSALVPIYDGPNREEFVGIIGVDVFMDSTEQIVNTRKPTPNSHMMLVNREGFIIFATKALYSALLCPGHPLCKECTAEAASLGECEQRSGEGTAFDLGGLEANGGTLSIARDAHFVPAASQEKLYQMMVKGSQPMDEVTIASTPEHHVQCLASPSCRFRVFRANFNADNMGWTLLMWVPEEDLEQSVGVELGSRPNDTIRLQDDETSELKNMQIINTGRLPLKWQALPDPTLVFSNTSGVLPPGETLWLGVGAVGAQLEPGQHILTAKVAVQDGLEGSCLSEQLTPQLKVVKFSSTQVCGRGNFLDAATASCVPCQPGQFGPEGEVNVCRACRPGTAVDHPGAIVCQNCSKGTAASSAQSTTCETCQPGRAAGGTGSQDCTLCAVGEYQSEEGSSECMKCPIGQITSEWTLVAGVYKWVAVEGAENASACGCNEGARNIGGECVGCGESEIEGLICRGKDDIEVYPGFYAADDALSVFKCHGASARCIGGKPGSTCAVGREGISCALCMAGYKSQTDGTCVPCGEGDSGEVTFVVLATAGCIGLVLLYIVVDRGLESRQSHLVLLLTLVFSMTVTLVQQLGIISLFENVVWVEPIKGILRIMELLVFDLELLHVSCIAAVTPLQSFILQVFALGIALAVMVLTHCVVTLVAYKAAFKARIQALLAAVGTIMLAFYISVIAALLGPLQCMDNPNGLHTVRGYPSVICWEADEHITMVIIAVIAVQAPLSFYAYCCWSVQRFASKMSDGDTQFLQAHKWLFFRYKPNTYWYAVVQMTRSLILALVPIIPDVSGQIVIMDIVMIMTLIIVVGAKPWRVERANVLDNVFTVSTLMTLICAAFYVEWSPGPALALLASILLIFCLFCLPIVMCATFVLLFTKSKRQKEFKYFLCHHKVGAGAFTRLLKMQLKRMIGSGTEVFVDSDNLVDLETLFDSVAFKTQVMVFVGSNELLTRPWCMGEITTAHRHNIPAVKLGLPDFSDPNDDFISNYATIMGDLSVLTSHSIAINHAQDAMRWFRDLPQISVPSEVDDSVIKDVSKAITESDAAANVLKPPATLQQSGVLKVPTASRGEAQTSARIIVDTSNWEACSTGRILERMLMVHYLDRPDLMPHILKSEEWLPSTTKQVILICSSGALESEDLMKKLLEVTNRNLPVSPVIAEDGFRFPTKTFVEEHRALALSILDAQQVSTDNVDEQLQAIKNIFAIIGIMFTAKMASEVVLQAKADEIAARVDYLSRQRVGKTGTENAGQDIGDTKVPA